MALPDSATSRLQPAPAALPLYRSLRNPTLSDAPPPAGSNQLLWPFRTPPPAGSNQLPLPFRCTVACGIPRCPTLCHQPAPTSSRGPAAAPPLAEPRAIRRSAISRHPSASESLPLPPRVVRRSAIRLAPTGNRDPAVRLRLQSPTPSAPGPATKNGERRVAPRRLVLVMRPRRHTPSGRYSALPPWLPPSEPPDLWRRRRRLGVPSPDDWPAACSPRVAPARSADLPRWASPA